MFFPSVNNNHSLWLPYLLIAVFFTLLFVFKDTISNWKEICKSKVRKWLHDKMVQVSVVGDTAKTESGFLTVFFHFLDDHFLKPEEDGVSYDYLLSDETGNNDYNLQHDREDKVEEEEEEEEEDEEEEDEEEEDGDKVNENIVAQH